MSDSEKEEEIVKIKQKIVGFSVKKPEDVVDAVDVAESSQKADDAKIDQSHQLEYVHEGIKRPRRLYGETFKIKPPGKDHGLYFTINDIVMNEGTDDEQRYPYELFLNSANMENYPWVIALTRVISATFRKGGNITFLISEFNAILDPAGGYFGKRLDSPKGIFYKSVLDEMGAIINQHFIDIGLIEPVLNISQENELKAKKTVSKSTKPTAAVKPVAVEPPKDSSGDSGSQLSPGQIETGKTCPECSEPNMQLRDNCYTCVNGCGHSKCG